MKLLFARIRACVVSHTLIGSDNNIKYFDIGIFANFTATKFNCPSKRHKFKTLCDGHLFGNDSLFERAETKYSIAHLLHPIQFYYITKNDLRYLLLDAYSILESNIFRV